MEYMVILDLRLTRDLLKNLKDDDPMADFVYSLTQLGDTDVRCLKTNFMDLMTSIEHSRTCWFRFMRNFNKILLRIYELHQQGKIIMVEALATDDLRSNGTNDLRNKVETMRYDLLQREKEARLLKEIIHPVDTECDFPHAQDVTHHAVDSYAI